MNNRFLYFFKDFLKLVLTVLKYYDTIYNVNIIFMGGFYMKKTYYVMDYQNENKRIDREEVIRAEERNFILTEQYTPEQIDEIKAELETAEKFAEWIEHKVDENLAPYLKGIVEAEQKPTWDDLEYDSETG